VSVFATSGTTYYIQVNSYHYAAAPPNPSSGYPRSDCVLTWNSPPITRIELRQRYAGAYQRADGVYERGPTN